MSRRAAIELSVVAALAAVVVLLFLNHLEADEYPAGLDPNAAAEVGDVPSWVSPTLTYTCEQCKEVACRFQASECRIAVKVIDRDGWYRLFWAGPETYVYDDAALLGGALRNRTAELAGGSWTIRGRYVPVEQPHPPHACPAAPKEVEIRYRLERGAFPDSIEPGIIASGALAIPRRFLWFRYPFPPDRVDDFWWELEKPN